MIVDDLIVYGKSKVHSDLAKMLLADLMDVNSLELLTMLDQPVPDEIINIYKYRVDELRKGRPIQYIIGNVNFCGNILEINENVLIPRFETEQLVVNTIEKIRELWPDENIDLIDLGTGSGAIGLSIKKKLPNINVTLLDISDKALEVAKKNATKLELNVKFILNDMLENLANKYDVIISNPPYIKNDEEMPPCFVLTIKGKEYVLKDDFDDNNINLILALSRRVGYLIHDLPDIVHTVVGGCVDLNHVHAGTSTKLL